MIMAAETNENRAERTIDNLDDRKVPGTDGGKAGISSSTGRDHGSRMPETPEHVQVSAIADEDEEGGLDPGHTPPNEPAD
jgi:hypothetical protein